MKKNTVAFAAAAAAAAAAAPQGGGGLDGGGETVPPPAPPPADLKPSPMAEEGKRAPRPVGFLHITIDQPVMSGGISWPVLCYLEVYVGGVFLVSRMLPLGSEEEEPMDKLRRCVMWGPLMLSIPVGLDWQDLSLELFANRVDYDRRCHPPLFRGGPHTSGFTAVIGRARVRLADALVVGDGVVVVDEDDEDDEDGKTGDQVRRKRRRRRGVRVETLEFAKTVVLTDLAPPPPGDAAGGPRLVARGKVRVSMSLKVEIAT
ncbi:hypothetical protein ACP4OV_002601 [Aristida adscensionis]